MAITAKMVKELRDATSVGMMDCKKALEETGGDFDAAVKILRERGAAVQAKRADKEAKEGKIDSIVSADAQNASMIEVNCETDFVARNEDFQQFVADLLSDAPNHPSGTMSEAKASIITDKIASIGEKMQIRRNETWTVEGTGLIASYIHMGGKVGVLLELGCEKPETLKAPVFTELAKDLTLHIAAAAPSHLTRDEVPAELIESEKEIFRTRLKAEDEEKGKSRPEQMINGILTGQINKFFSQICFIEQGFVKEDKLPVKDLIAQKSKDLDDTVVVKRYIRYQLGA